MNDKIKAIYDKIANKELSFGCKLLFNSEIYTFTRHDWKNYKTVEDDILVLKPSFTKIIWHPVMIWDVLDIIWDNELALSIWPNNCREAVLWYLDKPRKPIEEQSEDTINYIFNLIK